MHETPSRALGRYRTRSNPQKTAIVVVLILGMVLASPVVWVIAAVAAVAGLIVEAIRRRSFRIWLVAGGTAWGDVRSVTGVQDPSARRQDRIAAEWRR